MRPRRPAWVLPGAVIDIDFANMRSFGGPVSWGAGGNMAPGTSGVMNGSVNSACYHQMADGIFRLFPQSAIHVIPGKGLAQFGDSTWIVLQNRDLTNAAWTLTGCTAARSTGADGIANSGSRLTATANGATCTQAITRTSVAMLPSIVVRRVSGTGFISISADNGATSTVLPVTGQYTQFGGSRQTLTDPTFIITMQTAGDVFEIDFIGLETPGSNAPLVPGPPVVVTTAAVQRFRPTPEINNGRGGGGYPNGAFGERWINTLNSGQCAEYVEFSGTPRSGAGLVAATDGPGFIANFFPGNPIQLGGFTTTNVALPGVNRAIYGWEGALTAGGGGAAPASGCLNGGPMVSGLTSVAALVATHQVLGGQGSGAAVIDGFIPRIAMLEHRPDFAFMQRVTSFPA